jgi:4-hydroxy-tetrahydrodipicolinate synthase
MKKLKGVITAMVTPFDGRDGIDVAAIKRLVDFLVAKKVDCLYPCGTTGEMLLMTPEERELVAKTVVEAAAGRVTVYIHAGAMTLRDTLRLVAHARSIGADGVGVVTPSFFSVNETEMEEYFVAVARSVPSDYPVYLYNIPQCAGNDLKPATVSRIAEKCPNVVGIKYSWADMLRAAEYLRVRGGDFSVVFGPDRLYAPAMAMGCDGTVSGVSCVCPEAFVAVRDAFAKGDLAKARALQRSATDVCEFLRNGSNMAYFKAALKARGVDAGHMRAPLRDLPADEAARVGEGLEALLSAMSIPMMA